MAWWRRGHCRGRVIPFGLALVPATRLSCAFSPPVTHMQRCRSVMRSACLSPTECQILAQIHSFWPKYWGQLLHPVAFNKPDAALDIKTTRSTVHSPDVEICLRPTRYNSIQHKNTSCFSSSSSSVMLVQSLLVGRIKVWLLVGFSPLAWLFSWVWTCPWVRVCEPTASAPRTGSTSSIFVEMITFHGWQIDAILRVSSRISLRWSHGVSQPGDE